MELVAGVTLAALAIPEVMGYSTIAGMPVITGLYTIVLPVFAFAVFGSSRHLVVGADSATAAVMAASLAGMAATGTSQPVPRFDRIDATWRERSFSWPGWSGLGSSPIFSPEPY